MQHQSPGGATVEAVAHDGAVQPEGVGSMDAQLVGAARERLKADSGHAVVAFQHTVSGHGEPAVLAVHSLAGTVVDVGADGQIDDALILHDQAVEQGDITLADGVLFKLLLQSLMGRLVLGKDDQARGFLVQAMDHDGAMSLGVGGLVTC